MTFPSDPIKCARALGRLQSEYARIEWRIRELKLDLQYAHTPHKVKQAVDTFLESVDETRPSRSNSSET